jgi:hypothetical protein
VIIQLLYKVQGQDTSVKDASSKGQIVKGTNCVRINIQGHLGRGHVVMACYILSVAEFHRPLTGGPVRQPYAGVDLIPQSGSMNSAIGGKIKRSSSCVKLGSRRRMAI